MTSMPNAKPTRPGVHTATRPTVHTIKITLRHSRPPIWRRLQVPSSSTLEELHNAIQSAFGWENYHMWVFETSGAQYGIADRDLDIRNAAAKRLDQVAGRTGAKLSYTYDFGDDWEHDLVVDAVTGAEPGVAYPRCLSGRRACPPEDCGGIWGYDELLEILADPAHEEHIERLEWLGLDSADEFDPAAFDLDTVNSALSVLATQVASP
jgi:Plasmid pRiA4b ORF-3-like protein